MYIYIYIYIYIYPPPCFCAEHVWSFLVPSGTVELVGSGSFIRGGQPSACVTSHDPGWPFFHDFLDVVLGPSFFEFWLDFGPPNAPKIDPKSIKNLIIFLITFCNDFYTNSHSFFEFYNFLTHFGMVLGPEIVPKSIQNSLKKQLKKKYVSINLLSIFVWFWPQTLGCQGSQKSLFEVLLALGAILEPSWDQDGT